MLSFINYILMLEAKVDDLASKYPEHSDAIHKYNSADPTPTKKFLPWLVKQHISRHVTPDDVRLHSSLKNFDKVKHSLTTKDHTGYKHFNDLADTVEGHVKNKMEQEGKKNAVETIHSEPKTCVTAQHIKTKEASQELYGGGNEREGKRGCARGTSWCVSARSENNMFHHYGHMYTIHDPHDDHAPYAVHPFNGTITSRHNNGDNPHEEVVKKNPRIKKAVDAIMNHSAKHIDKDLEHESAKVRESAVGHSKATSAHIDKALNDKHYYVRKAAARNPNATAAHIDKAMGDEHHVVRTAAITNPNATAAHIGKALNDEDHNVREAAIQHPKATTEHIDKALTDADYHVRKLAVGHPNATSAHIDRALKDKSDSVRTAAITNPNATAKHIDKALKDKDDFVRAKAAQHPNATDAHISKGLKTGKKSTIV